MYLCVLGFKFKPELTSISMIKWLVSTKVLSTYYSYVMKKI